jgi:hypothetical protein
VGQLTPWIQPVPQEQQICRLNAGCAIWSVLALAENFRPGRFPRRILIVAGRKSDNKKVSFDRGILFELFMIPLELRGMQETKEFDLDLVNKCSPRTSAANR